MKQNIEYERERLQKIVEKEAEKEHHEQTKEDIDVTLQSTKGYWKELTITFAAPR